MILTIVILILIVVYLLIKVFVLSAIVRNITADRDFFVNMCHDIATKDDTDA